MAVTLGSLLAVVRSTTVEPVLLFFMFASFLTFSAFMALVYDKSCLHLYNSTFCQELDNNTFAEVHRNKQDKVQELSSSWIMNSNIAISVPATIALLLWMGSWGDRVGRRIPVIVPCIAAVLYSVSNLVNAVYMDWAPDILMIGPVFSGIGGSYLAILMASYTYLTHLADPKARMMRVGIAEAATFLAGTFSAFVSGKIVDSLGYVPAFGIALGCQALALLYAIFILPDIKSSVSNHTKECQCGTCCSSMCCGSVRDTYSFISTPRSVQIKVHLILFIIVLDILQLCTTGENDILLLYLKHVPRNWSYTKYGYYKGAENFTRGAAVLILLPLLKHYTSFRDTTLIMAGLVSKIIAMVLLGLAQSTWAIFLVVVVGMLQGFPSAGLRASMASLVQTFEQGRLFGIVAATESLISLFSTLLFNKVYPLTLEVYDGLCFQLSAGLSVLCLLIVLWQHLNLKRGDESSIQEQAIIDDQDTLEE